MHAFRFALTTVLISLLGLAIPATSSAAPDVTVLSVDAPEMLFIGRPNEIRARIKNIGSSAATGFDYRIVLSDSNTITLYDRSIFDDGPISLAAGQEIQLVKHVEIEPDVEPRDYFVGVILDPADVLGEINRANNVMAASHRSKVREPAADLWVSEVRTGDLGAAGETIRVAFTVENRGNLDAAFDYGVYLSHNSIISAEDVLLFHGGDVLPAGEWHRHTLHALLPAGLPAGTYHVGVIADPDGVLEELDKTGNLGRAVIPVQVQAAALRFVTSWIPESIVGERFSWRFVAMGGTGAYAFSVAHGDLPPGVALDSELGEIHGTPLEPGEWPFVLEVRSGGLEVFSGYVLRVVRPSVSLAMNTAALPPAIQQSEYRMRLAAMGGQPPYSWTVSSLPSGITLDDDGLLHGAPLIIGSFPLDIRVRDDSGQSVRRTLDLRIVDRGSLAILTGLLPPGMVGQGYSPIGMEAIGANGAVTWSLVDGQMPPGITLEPESGIIRGIPERSGRFSFRVRARDEAGLSDINGYSIDVLTQPLSIVTHDATPATVGESYEQAFQVLGSDRAPYEWSLLSGLLPEGLSLDAEHGKILGVPGEGTEGLYTFGMRVEDAAGATGMRAYVLEVRSLSRDRELAEQPLGGGCASGSGGSMSLVLVFILLLPLVFCRRRAAGIAVALFALFLSPSIASSQTPIYSVMDYERAYEEVTGGTVLQFDSYWDGNTRVTLPFAFNFFGQNYNQISVSVNGLIGFEPLQSQHWSNHPIPDPRAPNGMVALWWDDLDARPADAQISTRVLGSAPDRVFVVQWKNVARSSGSQINFQARLYEGRNAIEVLYGSFTGSSSGSAASVGIENQTGTVGLVGLACTPNCGQVHFPAGRAISYGTLANLVASDVIVPGTVWSGVPAQVSGLVRNLGGDDAGPFDVIVVVSDSPDGILGGTEMGRTRVTGGLLAGASKEVSLLAEIPQDLTPGEEYWVSIIPNPEREIDDVGRGQNFAPPKIVRVGQAMPNLRVVGVYPATPQVAPGASISVSYELANTGNLPAETSYWVVLSANNVITVQDLVLHQGTVSLPARGGVTRHTNMTVPVSLLPGPYYVGVVLDPHGLVSEPDLTGNALASSDPVNVIGDDLVVLSTSLPIGRVDRPYSALLRAAGGTQAYRWTVTSGSLPPGLKLWEDGWIDGRPQTEGDHAFTVLLRSGSLHAVVQLGIAVDEAATPLTIVSGSLPGGAIGVDYFASVMATGGEPPYWWGLQAGSTPPPGLSLTDAGAIVGIPREPGVHRIGLQVVDALGEAATGSFDLDIGATGQVVVTTAGLPAGVLDDEYSFALRAAGGSEPYRWTVDSATPLPSGLSLSGSGLIEGVPRQVGVFDVMLTVRDDRGHTNSNIFSLKIGYSQGLAITTQRLPRATGGWEYEAQLAVWSGAAPFTWSIVNGSLPYGLSFSEDMGLISGAPADEGIDRHFPFIVEVTDAAGRKALRALSITVGPAPAVLDSEGCSAAPGGAGSGMGVLVLALLVLVVSRSLRKRHGRVAVRASAPGVVVAVMFLAAGLSAGCGSSNPCEGVVCPAGTACSQADGECRCGGPGGEFCGLNEVCDPASGSCVSTANACEGLACSDGLTCDPDDGVCKCGGAGGTLCAGDELCEPTTGRCVSPDRCLGVHCAGEEYCHPDFGRCYCGEAPGCAIGERCHHGDCVTDSCYGVTCSGGSVCDPSDGSCRCGGISGPICEPDEVCDPATRTCSPAASCSRVDCPVGMSCDPADGVCKCGGPDGEACRADQYCDPFSSQCLGGDPCDGVTCTAGTTCDPEDGACRCGGHGGELCDAGEWCAEPEGIERLCSPVCSPVFQDCAHAELGCYYDSMSNQSFCYERGQAGDGVTCHIPTDCQPGLFCRPEGHSGRCRQLCDTAATFPAPGSCFLQHFCDPIFDHRPELGVCISTG